MANTNSCSGDIFVASVINQKAVNQNAQQILVAVAAQVINLTEAQFGFSTNDDSDTVNV
ncbi:hypothetical protein [Petroclostridium xylanilyticum]|jgi:hypothetical protein|uniref:hypothetical protein n=1 Tax=Petroclostridium xylanilyticum TaxID=1792311 RepID=UPI0018E2FEB7|nr:hypothetical protein [Petroclostridium xylanilyticum]